MIIVHNGQIAKITKNKIGFSTKYFTHGFTDWIDCLVIDFGFGKIDKINSKNYLWINQKI